MKKETAPVIAALIAMFLAVGYFVYTLNKEKPEYVIEDVNGVPALSPGAGLRTPDGPPDVQPPTTPPPQ